MSDYKYSIEAKNVNKVFYKKSQQVNALIDFSIKIEKGTIHGLLGPNGAGKSTFVKIIYGLLKPDSGHVIWKNEIIEINGPKHARELGIGMVFQHFSLFEALTVLENISLALPEKNQSDDLENRIEIISNEYGLQIDPKSRVFNLLSLIHI